jgi:DNA polymerase-3 subunit alpha
MHAGGVIIWNKLSDVLPVKCINNMDGKRIKRVVCFDMDDLHELGHFKFDILGLKTLETLELALKNVKEVYGIDIDLNKIDYEDKNVIAMLASGNVKGVFQLEEQAQRVKQQCPQNFRDIIAINALIRPGTGTNYFRRRIGEVEWSIIPEREWYMAETYGDYVYQEQYMLDAHILAGWDLAYADKKLRKNKDIRNDVETKTKFFEDCRKVGLLKTEAEIAEIWANIEDTVDGGYGFNKSHATTYGRIAFQEAYLMYYYPECFYCAVLTKKGDDQEKVGEFIAECKHKGIKILPPDINKSEDNFIPTPGGIMYRLTSITNVGDSAIRGIKDIRPIKSLQDLLERRNKSLIKKNVVESLIKAGVFDFEQPDRQRVMHQLDQHHRTKTQIKEGFECPLREFDKLAWEKEALGIYLSSHPLDKYAFKPLLAHQDNSNCLIAGIVDNVRTLYDKNGNEMAFITISNQQGSIKCIAFTETWTNKVLCLQEKVEYGNIIMIRGRRSGNDAIIDTMEIVEKLA